MRDREVLAQIIGRFLDHPSVYMGGASTWSLEKANELIRVIEPFLKEDKGYVHDPVKNENKLRCAFWFLHSSF